MDTIPASPAVAELRESIRAQIEASRRHIDALARNREVRAGEPGQCRIQDDDRRDPIDSMESWLREEEASRQRP